MELRDKEELAKLRATLDRQIQILHTGRVGGPSPRALVKKLKVQIAEIDELLENGETGDA